MMAILEGVIPRIHEPLKNLLRKTGVPLTALLLIILSVGAIGCGPKIARVEVSPEDMIKANEHVKEGIEAHKNKDYYAALIQYLMAAELNPNSEFISNYVGITYLQLDYYDKAIEAFQRSVGLNSKYSSAINNLGSVYFAKKNYKKAEKYFKKAIKMKKDDASYHMNLGSLYFEMKKPDKAFREWRTSLSLDPEILSRNNAANVSISGGDIQPKDRYYFMARVYAVAANVPKTIESLENALMNGFTDIKALQENPDFDTIRKDERFINFLEDAEAWKPTE